MKKIADDIYEVKLPLEGSSLKELSCYMIKGGEANCIMDVGFETPDCDRILREAVKELELEPEKTDIILTHTHRDHCGNLPNLYKDFRYVRCSKWDAGQITGTNPMSHKEYLRDHFTKSGMPLSFLEHMPKRGDISALIPMEKIRVLEEGDMCSYGNCHFRVLDLKGHMPGQIGLYEESRQILFPGDHILNKITPNIGYYAEENHSLQNYLDNLMKVRDLPVQHVYPAHRGEITDLKGRVDELFAHHDERIGEITGILYNKTMCAYEVAGRIKWYYKGGDFNAYPVAMKYMATSEILAHLQYLYERGEASRTGGAGETYLYRYGD